MEGRGRDVWIYMTCPALPRKMVGNFPRTGISFFFPILGAAMAGRNRPRSEVPVIPKRPRTRRQPNDAAPKIPPSSRPSRPVPASTPRLRTRRPPANCLPLDLLFQIGACTTQAWPQNGKSPPSHVLHALLVLFHAGFLRPFKGRLVQQPIPSWLAPAPGNPANVSGHPVATNHVKGRVRLWYGPDHSGKFTLDKHSEPSPAPESRPTQGHLPQIPRTRLPSLRPSAPSNLGPPLSPGQPILAPTSATTLASPSNAMPATVTGLAAEKSTVTDQGEETETSQGHTDVARGAQHKSRKPWSQRDEWLLWWLWHQKVSDQINAEV